MRILNFGSLNIDLVYRVPHIVRPGETIASRSFTTFAGGKGANQSVALGRAGADVSHAGRIGADGKWLLDKLRDAGVDTSRVQVGSEPTGSAVIQVDDEGQNAIFLNAGANHKITTEQVTQTLADFGAGDLLLLQNEINDGARVLEQGKARGMTVCLNPAPFGPELLDWPLEQVDMLVVNESEAAGLAGLSETGDPVALLTALRAKFARTELVLTLGGRGVAWCGAGAVQQWPAESVKALDTTAAGDTFIGFFLAGIAGGMDRPTAIGRGQRAAALSVTRPGAMDSIPMALEV